MNRATPNLDDAAHLLAELERIESKLRLLQDGLTRSHRLATLGTIASFIAHEFNNILTPVVSYCQLAEQNPDDIQLLRKAVSKALAGARHAAEISSSMLGFARSGEGEKSADVADVVKEVFACLGRPPERDGIRLTVNVAAGIRAAINPVHLQQVVLNLVLNARQAMRRKGGELHITAEPVGTSIHITVRDTGPGIPADILPRVFEPFVSTRQGGNDEERGTGLGLAICRDLIRGARGEITITQTGQGGTTFRIDLPAAPASPAQITANVQSAA